MANRSGLPTGNEQQLDYPTIQSQVQFLQGKVLTVIDASYSNERQLKAIKDLIKTAFNEQLTWIAQLCHPDVHMWSRDQLKATGEDVERIEAEATCICNAVHQGECAKPRI